MILPVSFVIAFVIKLFPFDVIIILPSLFVIALDIDKLAVGDKNDSVLKLSSMNREAAIKVFEQYKNDKDKIIY